MSDGVIHGHFRFESGILISTMISSSYYILINVYGIKSIVRSRNTILNIMYFGWRKYNTEPILSIFSISSHYYQDASQIYRNFWNKVRKEHKCFLILYLEDKNCPRLACNRIYACNNKKEEELSFY